MTTTLTEPVLDERALVRTLKVLRQLIEEEHALEVDRAARLDPLLFETAAVVGASGRACRFRVTGQGSRSDPDRAALRVGSGVEIVPREGRAACAFGVVSALDAATVTVDFGRTLQPGVIPPAGLLRVRVDDNQRNIRLQAIERVVRERHRLAWVGAVLADAAVAPLAETDGDPFSDLDVTTGQRRALVSASRSRDLFLIQGPPGTGKTTVITALVRYLAQERGARVLLSSKGHRAIDNALDRLGSADLHLLRLGQAAKVTGAGQALLLADATTEAERDVPQRHLAARTQLEEWLPLLSQVERVLADIEALNEQIAESDTTVAKDTGETQFERTPKPVHRLVRRLHETFRLASAAGLGRLPGVRRQQRWPHDGEEHGVAPEEHRSELRTQHVRLMKRAESALGNLPAGVHGLRLPELSVATPHDIRTSLAAVRHARNQVRAVLHELKAWGTLVESPGVVSEVLVETADVIAATAVGINSGRDGARIAELDFDVAIVDEAGQAQLTDLIVPFSRARTVILVGDHQQLPPYLDDELLRRCADTGIDTAWLEKSVFEHLWDRVPETHRARLDVQFRMPETIASFLGRIFYAGELQSAAAKQGNPPVCDLFGSSVVLVDTSGVEDRSETPVSPGFVNRCEAHLVTEIVAHLPAHYRAGEGLGVIAPYSGQVAAVRRSLADALGLATGDAWLLDNVATVDSFQGQERDVIVVSLTRSNPDGTVGFLSDLKRLNVTLSRAREQLVVIGDLSTLCAPGGGQERRAFARFMRELAEHAGAHGELLEANELRLRLGSG